MSRLVLARVRVTHVKGVMEVVQLAKSTSIERAHEDEKVKLKNFTFDGRYIIPQVKRETSVSGIVGEVDAGKKGEKRRDDASRQAQTVHISTP